MLIFQFLEIVWYWFFQNCRIKTKWKKKEQNSKMKWSILFSFFFFDLNSIFIFSFVNCFRWKCAIHDKNDYRTVQLMSIYFNYSNWKIKNTTSHHVKYFISRNLARIKNGEIFSFSIVRFSRSKKTKNEYYTYLF